MSKPKWQRARVIRVASGKQHQWALGTEFWVRCGAPNHEATYEHGTLNVIEDDRARYVTHLIGSHPRHGKLPHAADADCVELLARSPDDFADEVPLQDYADWVREQRARKAGAA